MLTWPGLALVGGGAAKMDVSSAISELYRGRTLLVTNCIVDTDVFHVVMYVARYGSNMARYHRPQGC